jgi:uncharacterized iron-regulated protein
MKSLLLLITFLSAAANSPLPVYKIFSSKGKETAYAAILNEAKQADVILFGELHNNPIAHWLQLELTQDLYKVKGDKLVLGAEMFEADNQLIIDEYLAGKISEKTFKSEARLWSNYATDYRPLVEFAKKNNLVFAATNVPRRYANMVYNNGIESLESLRPEALNYIAPQPMKYDPELKSYREITKATGGHGGENLPRSQALKDATMAHFIMKNFSEGKIFLHFNGAYHSNNYEGIYWYLKEQFPKLKIMTISTVEQEQLDSLKKEHTGIADFIIATPENLTKTH